MKATLLLLISVFLLLGCNNDSTTVHDIFRSEYNPEKQTVILSNGGESIVIYELDSLFNKKDSQALSVITDTTFNYLNNPISYSYHIDLSEVSLTTKYALIEFVNVQHLYNDSSSSGTPYILEYLVEKGHTIDERWNVDNERKDMLCSHVTQKRVMQLIKEGYPYTPAQEIARAELQSIWDDTTCNSYILETMLYNFSEGKHETEDFQEDLSDGILNDTAHLIKKIDRLLDFGKNPYDSSACRMYNNLLAKYLVKKQCDVFSKKVAVTNEQSSHFKDSLVCDSMYSQQYFRLYSELDYALGPCVNLPKKRYTCTDDTTCYLCQFSRWLSTKNLAGEPKNSAGLDSALALEEKTRPY